MFGSAARRARLPDGFRVGSDMFEVRRFNTVPDAGDMIVVTYTPSR